MSLIRAGGLTTLILSVLTTAALVAFGSWYTHNTTGEVVGHVLLWLPISLLVVAPVCLIVLPLLHVLANSAGRSSGKLFALAGGFIGAAISGYALFRFRGNLAISPAILFLGLPLLVMIATALGIFGGLIFERLARRSASASGRERPASYEDPLPPPHPGDLKTPVERDSSRR